MELRDYARILTRRGWVLLLSVLVTTLSAVVFSRLQTPVYRSRIMLNVWSGRLDWGLQQTIKGLLRNYALNIESRQTAAEVVDRLQLDLSPEQLQAKLTVSPIESDFLIQIDADDYDAVIASEIAQTTAEVFVERTKVYMLEQDKRDRVEVSILDHAEAGRLHKPKWKINAVAGAAFGLVVGVLVVFLLEWLEADLIRTMADVERHTGLAVLGTIPIAAPAMAHPRRPARE